MDRVKEEKDSVELTKDREKKSNWLTWLKEIFSLRIRIPIGALGTIAVVLVLIAVSGGIPDYTPNKQAPQKSRNMDYLEIEDRGAQPAPMKTPRSTQYGGQKMDLTAEKAEVEETERKIIKRANLQIEIKDISKVSKDVIALVEKYQGEISDSREWVTGQNRQYSRYELRIPSEEFYQAIDQLEEMGKVVSRSISGQDVTEEYIDLESRLKNLKSQEERYRQLLNKAEEVEDILKIERELSRVRGNIESLQGRLKYYDNRVNMSTINVEFREPEPITSTQWGIIQALRRAVREMSDTFHNMLIGLGRILPYLLILFVLYLIYKIKKR